eukprot:6435898-Amphidinium_carterae.2
MLLFMSHMAYWWRVQRFGEVILNQLGEVVLEKLRSSGRVEEVDEGIKATVRSGLQCPTFWCHPRGFLGCLDAGQILG